MLIDTWIVSAHGCLWTDSTKQEPELEYIDIPNNCLVIMLCTNENVICNKATDFFNQVSQRALNGWDTTITEDTDIDLFLNSFVPNLKYYFNASPYYDKFCLFVDKVPLLSLIASKIDAKKMYCGYSRAGPDAKTKSTAVNECKTTTFFDLVNKTRNMQTMFHILIINTCASSDRMQDPLSFMGIPLNSDKARAAMVTKMITFFHFKDTGRGKGGNTRKILRLQQREKRKNMV